MTCLIFLYGSEHTKQHKLTLYPADCFTREKGCGNSQVGLAIKERSSITCLKLKPRPCLVHVKLWLTKISLAKFLAKVLLANIRTTAGKKKIQT